MIPPMCGLVEFFRMTDCLMYFAETH